MKFIKNKNEYLDKFTINSDEKCKDENSKIEKALEVALDTRKFEIELYWKRATYFWAFIAASLTAYFVILASASVGKFKYLTIVISMIGYLFSMGWYLANRGSKYWQENWERHVSSLEEIIQGPLFTYIRNPSEYKFRNILSGYPYSVSKVNQFLSIIMIIFWLGLFGYSLLFSYNKLEEVKKILMFTEDTRWFIGMWLISIAFITFLFISKTKSFMMKTLNKLPKDKKEEIKNHLFMHSGLKKELSLSCKEEVKDDTLN